MSGFDPNGSAWAALDAPYRFVFAFLHALRDGENDWAQECIADDATPGLRDQVGDPRARELCFLLRPEFGVYVTDGPQIEGVDEEIVTLAEYFEENERIEAGVVERRRAVNFHMATTDEGFRIRRIVRIGC